MNAFGNSKKKKNLNVSQYKKIIRLNFLQNLSLLKSLLLKQKIFVLKSTCNDKVKCLFEIK